MAYTKINNLQTDVDENEMIHIDMDRKNSNIPKLVDEASIASSKLVDISDSPVKSKKITFTGNCDGCIHLHVCKYKDKFDNFKSELEEVYEDANGAEFMNVDVNAICSYFKEDRQND